jgi:hypothetical protein
MRSALGKFYRPTLPGVPGGLPATSRLIAQSCNNYRETLMTVFINDLSCRRCWDLVVGSRSHGFAPRLWSSQRRFWHSGLNINVRS